VDYHRHTLRLRKDTYSHPGIYFVTIGSIKHVCIFGEIKDNQFLINNLGKIILDNYNKLNQRFKNIDLDLIQLMPNHIHCLIRIKNNSCRGVIHHAQNEIDILKTNKHMGLINQTPTLGQMIRYWKAKSTREINCRGGVAPPLFKKNWNHWLEGKVFQRNYFERIIRNDEELEKIRQYIKSNPLIWDRDRNNPSNLKRII
jgi:putative transposase